MPLFPEISAILYDSNLLFSIGDIMAGKKNINYDELIGKKFGSWTVLGYFTSKKHQCIMVECICECGYESSVQSHGLRGGRSKKCKQCAPTNHGYSRSKDPIKSATYRAWNAARNRCNNPGNKDYIHYGARGITVDPSWDDFLVFLKDMGEKPKGLTLDRIDNNGPYSKSNCRWATYSQQNSNQRIRKKKEN